MLKMNLSFKISRPLRINLVSFGLGKLEIFPKYCNPNPSSDFGTVKTAPYKQTIN